jgi:bacteriochlorophyllide a dehydrogenase
MRALQFELGKVEIGEIERPAGCGPTEVLSQAMLTGITNGTERNVLVGGNYRSAEYPDHGVGYQHVGTVIEVGGEVRDYAIGDLIYSDTPHREINRVEVCDRANTIKLPETVEPRHAALFGVASVAMHTVRRSGLTAGEKVLVVGAGLIGQFTAQCARLTGGGVTICDLDADRLEIAADLGAEPCELSTEPASWDAVRERGPFDVVFEDSGAPILDQLIGEYVPAEGAFAPAGVGRETLELSRLPVATILARRGEARTRLVLVAGRDRVGYNFNAAQGQEIAVLHANHFDVDDLSEVCRHASAGELQIGPLITREVALAEAPAVYQRLIDEPGSLLGTVFDWRAG